LPHRGPDAIAEHQPSVASLPARLRARLVDDRAYQQSKDQLARAGSIGVEGSHHCVALIECEHVRISTVIEKHLERVPTMLRDADDQHVVIIPQKVQLRASEIARRRTERERAEAFFPLRATTTAADSKRDARAALKVSSQARPST
jgi:hypothetical protein